MEPREFKSRSDMEAFAKAYESEQALTFFLPNKSDRRTDPAFVVGLMKQRFTLC